MTRFALVLALLALFALALVGMWFGWKHRAQRQESLPELVAAPAYLGPDRAPALSGLYVGTTTALHWQDRIVAHRLGERAEAMSRITGEGVLIERRGSPAIFIPTAALIDARLEPALAGKVVGDGGLLVLRWRLGDFDLDTGLRADDKGIYPAWVRAIQRQGVVSE